MQDRITEILKGLPIPSDHRTAVTLEGNAVRVVSARGRRVVSWSSLLIPPGLVRSGLISDTKAMADLLRTALGDAKKGKVVAALPGLNTVSRIITAPQARGVNLKELAHREARRLLSVKLEESYIYWVSLRQRAAQQRILLVMVPRIMTAQYVEALYEAGVSLSQLELKPFALARAANATQGVVVNLEESGMDFVILQDGFPTTYRSLSFGGENLALEVLFPRLLNELTRYINFHNSANPGNILRTEAPLFLCGATTLPPEHRQALEQAAGRPTAPFASPLTFPPDFPAGSLAVNLGLLLKGL
ncbi:MAG: hypothetical protein HY687_01055 [Chloroflexi bacterium]|nr:hypothetical protein [Chloroflexota bacterium]